MNVKNQIDARKVSYEGAEALKLAGEMSKIVIARGKKVVSYDMITDRPGREVLLKGLLGPGGKLRAPTIRVGTTLIVGFSETAYGAALT